MTFDWKKLGGFVKFALQTPMGLSATKAILNELEQNPEYLRFVEKHQRMGAQQCMICAFHKYGRERGLNTAERPPQHECPDRR